MNKRQKLVQQQFINNEEAVIKRLKTVYNKSLEDITAKSKALQDEINSITAMIGMTEDADEIAQLKSMEQSKIYQKQYQDAMKKQIGSILDNMQVEEFKTVSSYLQTCYEDGFIGTMYDLQGQGIPLCFPLDQEAMVRAVQLDSKISQGLYSRLGEDVSLLKKKITAQVSRGIATGMSYQQVAQQLASYTNIGFNNAVRIARTEGHRIQVQSGMDACYKAKSKGADVVKQWDATLDSSTRESHQQVDGEIRELDKPFSNGLMFPGDPSGGAAEVVNCRCALLQRARWALDEDELQTLKDRAEFYGLDKTKNFEEFKQKYLKAAEAEKGLTNYVNSDKIHPEKFVFVPAKDMKEAKTRFANSLGLPEDKISLGRMKPELANQYLEGVERFMNDFPMLKGYYGTLGTKTGSPNTLGLNRLIGKYESHNGANYIRYSSELHFKNPQDIAKMMKTYDWVSNSGEGYVNSTPLSTAIHELVHGIDKAITLKRHGAFSDNSLDGLVIGSDHGQAIAGVSRKIIPQVRQEMFGAQYGKEIADATRYLGRYARTSPSEELAEAISYEYVNESNPYSARILELFKKEVEGVFGK